MGGEKTRFMCHKTVIKPQNKEPKKQYCTKTDNVGIANLLIIKNG